MLCLLISCPLKRGNLSRYSFHSFSLSCSLNQDFILSTWIHFIPVASAAITPGLHFQIRGNPPGKAPAFRLPAGKDPGKASYLAYPPHLPAHLPAYTPHLPAHLPGNLFSTPPAYHFSGTSRYHSYLQFSGMSYQMVYHNLNRLGLRYELLIEHCGF
jgi:hypothetical protein